ncbi:MAG: bifunctional UDP-N-acetylglucosamine diphosphorylase/glucosamine-1-phosphate N-acetyltransferase GlmU [Tissierellia bacterium]|nr:bifunctional UDP-N-acetylglucosamine diphosphorylase/glucosamine-1-phosphate N-acetyltransferase GlmU [Tissierellia bacterium]
MKKAIILAAGEGTRMKSKKSKVLHTLLGQKMISYVLESAKDAGVDEIIVIGGKNLNELKNELSGEDIRFVEQPIGDEFPYGTGYAVSLCEEYINEKDEILILTGDTPLIRGESLKALMAEHKDHYGATVLTADIDDPTGYGRIVRDEQGNFHKIVEDRDCNEEEKRIKEFNSGLMIVNGKELIESLGEISDENDQGEMYLTDIFEILHGKDCAIGTYKLKDVNEVYGINSKAQLSFAEEILRERINGYWMEEGVVMENPSTITIEPTVLLHQDVILSSGVRLYGDTEVLENTKITGDCEIRNSKIGKGVVIQSSYIEDSEVKDFADVGPFAHLRMNTVIGEKVHIGNFVEVKNSVIEQGSKAGHLVYVGDADVGTDVNISCGVIFANYDGKNKYRSKVDDGAFIGSNVNLVAPVHVKEESFIACGSTITEDVEEGSLAIARARQVNKKDWYKKKKDEWK